MSIHEIDSYSNVACAMFDTSFDGSASSNIDNNHPVDKDVSKSITDKKHPVDKDVSKSITDKKHPVDKDENKSITDKKHPVGSNGSVPINDESDSTDNNGYQLPNYEKMACYKISHLDKSSKKFIVSENDVDKIMIVANRFFHGWNILDWRNHYDMQAMHTNKKLAHAVDHHSDTIIGIIFSSKPTVNLVIDYRDSNRNKVKEVKTSPQSEKEFLFEDKNWHVLSRVKLHVKPNEKEFYFSIKDDVTNKLIGIIVPVKATVSNADASNKHNEHFYKVMLDKNIDNRPFLLFSAHLFNKGFNFNDFEKIAK